MVPVIRAPEAERDLVEIADYLAQSSPGTARRFLNAAEDAFNTLAQFPEFGATYETINPRLAGLRVLPVPRFRRHLIFYRVQQDRVEVARVLSGARDLDQL